jgi:lysophospholipase L1-like esterase
MDWHPRGDVAKTSRNPRRVFPTSALVVGSTVFALLVAEIVLRVIGFEFALYPTKVEFGWPDPVTMEKMYKPDKDLLWVPNNYDAKLTRWDTTSPSIVFMGCSCTQFGRYDKFLVSAMDEHCAGSDLTFVNLGVGGWSSYQGLQQLKRDVVPMKPRIATIFYGWNDHWSGFGYEDKEIGKFNEEHATLLTTLAQSRVVQLVNRAVFTIKHPGVARDERRPERVPLLDFTTNLVEMVRTANENGITPVLITAPSTHKKGEEPEYLTSRRLNDLSELVPLHESYVRAVREVAAQENVVLIDLYQVFLQFPQEDLDRFFFKDGVHLTEDGNKKVAEIMHEHFDRHGLTMLLSAAR